MTYIPISIKDSTGRLHNLPYPTNSRQPVFCWELPKGVVQSAYCLELKSRFPTTLSDGTYGFAYYNSSLVSSSAREHLINFEMFTNVWACLIEVRLRIYDVDGRVILSTHEPSDYEYPFEAIPQGYAWDSTYDGYYYLLDDIVEQIAGVMTPTFQWRNVVDEDLQSVSYQLQWSLTPLFLDGVYGQSGLSNTRTIDAQGINSLNTTLSTVVDVKAPIFYRVRAFDGLDYSDWSQVNGFYCSPSSAPFCVFNSVQSNCLTTNPNILQRPNGEVEISFRVVDIDTELVSAYLLYKLDDVEYPCSLNCSTVSIPANKDMTVTWQSARQLPNRNVSVHLYLYAYDGNTESNKIVWESPVIINNTGIGFGYNDGTNDKMEYRFSGTLRNYERYIQIPKEKSQVIIQDGKAVYKPVDIPNGALEANRFDWASYWSNELDNNLASYLYTAEDGYVQKYEGRVRRTTWNIYDGYDSVNERIEKDKLFLEYKDDFDGREKGDGERFVRYYGKENNDSISQEPELGRGIESITYFVKPAEYGRYFSIRRPTIVKAGTLGLYFDGAGLNNKASDYLSYEEPIPQAIKKLMETEIWKVFYQIDPMFYPEVQVESTFVGPIDENRYDRENGWYWTLFEYHIKLDFPFSITRNVNDRFAYRYNGVTYEGSILEDDTDSVYLTCSEGVDGQLKAMLKRLFPEAIFMLVTSVNPLNGKCAFTVYSKQTDANKVFQFVQTMNNCYSVFGIDCNVRFSRRNKCTGATENHVTFNPYDPKKPKAVFEVECDTGNCIGEDGEINGTEPLFTCDPYHLNKYGCHYKYTLNRFLLSGKVYIRKYIVKPVYKTESAEPLREIIDGETSVPAMGYRNYRLKYVGVNAIGEPLYEKEFLGNNIGGIPAKCRMINVVFEKRELVEPGYWVPEADIEDSEACISHKYDEDTGKYTRKNPSEYIDEIGLQDCFCTEYVELNEGWEKPFFDDGQGTGRVNTKQPVSQNAAIPQGYIQYIMGAYKPPVNQTEELSSSNYTSVVETDSDGNLGRYNSYWDDSSSERYSEKQGTVVAPGLIEIGGNEKTIEKWGYVPDLTLQNYFKRDENNIWKGRVIPANNGYVHDVYRDNSISFPNNNRVHTFRRLISDTNKVELPTEEGIKVDDVDYRIAGGTPLDTKYYYYALPREESKAYSTRPDAIYAEDSPTRISGFMDVMNTVVPWKFLYLQTEWNSYNLIHWEGSQDENVYAKIEVAEIDSNNRPGSFMTLRTKNAKWFGKYSCWLITYEKLKQSDYIDTLNGTFFSIQEDFRIEHSFEDNHRYMFRISGMNINSGTTNAPVSSTIFTYSKDAYSPPVITNVDYNKWSHEFEIEFRFDDVHGRKYDIVNFYYVTYAPNSSSPLDAEFIQLGTEVLEGNLTDLSSNILGDNVVSEAYLNKHKVYFSSDHISGLEGKNIRFRLESIASEDRDGMTLPVFNFRMWTNEFLKKADRQIDAIVGRKNRWVYDVSIDDNGDTIEKWKYLPEEKAVIVPGIISEQNATINRINEKFEDWYLTVAKYQEPSFDARYNHLCINKKDNELFSDCFEAFIERFELTEEWEEFKNTYSTKTEKYLEPIFISGKGYDEDFRFFWDNKAASMIEDISSFSPWFEDNKMLSRTEAKPLFFAGNEYSEEYQEYLQENSLTDNDDNRTDYISEKSYQTQFEQYYVLLNNYPDGRFDDRKAFVDTNYSERFAEWKLNPADAYGEAIDNTLLFCEDDQYRQFIASDREIWEEMLYTNRGKQSAKQYFLSSSMNGVTYGQQLHTANREIEKAQATLNEAYCIRNYYETIHRRKLIAKGYFSNGWKNNQAYLPNGTKNEVFRFRVENQPTSEKRETETPELDLGNTTPTIVAPIAGYDTRWDVYFHFQLDFFDSFDSQNGRPLRDYLWQRLDTSGYAGDDVDSINVDGNTYIRIMGAIEADSGMHILPENVYTPDSTSGTTSPTTNEPYSLQLAGRFSIPKSELPGELEDSSAIPEYWKRNIENPSKDFNQLYFWRVCPYNVVKRQILEKEHCVVNNIEYLGTHNTTGNSVWKVDLSNTFFGNHKYSKLSSENDIYYVWIATEEIAPTWKCDYDSDCWNELDAFYENYFMGTDNKRFDLDYEQNPIRESYQRRIERGEIVFLTDRPREFEDGNLRYVEDDTTNHFKSLWIPFNTNRSKPWMLYDNEEKCWFLIYQKLSKNRNGYNENVLILSRGLSPQTFGEECQLFPSSTLLSVESVIPGALSFETPKMLKIDGVYHLYFCVRKANNIFELWKGESSNIYEWDNFQQLTFDTNADISDFSLCFKDGEYSIYTIQGTSIKKYTSMDGLNFLFTQNIHEDMYTLTSPALCSGRIFFGIEFGNKGKILSIDESGDYSSLRVEKGSDVDFESAITFNDEDIYFSPMVFEDYDKGTVVHRIVYEKTDTVFAYEDSVMKELEISERAFFTEYQEEYSWSKVSLNNHYVVDDYYGSRLLCNNHYVPMLSDEEGNKISIYSQDCYVPVGRLELLLINDTRPLQVKIPFYLEGMEEIESEGEWIDNKSIAQTNAWLSPEELPEDYDADNYTMNNFISENSLNVLYENWKSEVYPSQVDEKEEQYMTEFLLQCKQYSEYLKWSKKGPGIFRYSDVVKRTSYVGDGTNV